MIKLVPNLSMKLDAPVCTIVMISVSLKGIEIRLAQGKVGEHGIKAIMYCAKASGLVRIPQSKKQNRKDQQD